MAAFAKCFSQQKFYDDPFKSEEILDIAELYINENYNIVLDKLKNKDYKIKMYAQDYELNRAIYTGHFELDKEIKVDDWEIFTTSSSWRFKTIDHGNLVKEFEIKFEILMTTYPISVYEGLNNRLSNRYDQIDWPECKRKLRRKNTLKCARFVKFDTLWCKTIFDYSPSFKLNPYWAMIEKWTMSVSGEDISGDTISIAMGENQEFKVLDISLNDYDKYSTLTGSFYYRILNNKIDNPEDILADYKTGKKEYKIHVPIKKLENIQIVKVSIGGIEFDYIIDSGASYLTISKRSLEYLEKIGVVRNSDYLKEKMIMLADGSINEYQAVLLPIISIENENIKNVEAIIVENDAPLLLGQSFFKKFRSWQIDNDNSILKLIR